MILFKLPLTADQLQRLRKFFAETPQPKSPRPEINVRRAVLTLVLIYLNLVLAAILIHMIAA